MNEPTDEKFVDILDRLKYGETIQVPITKPTKKPTQGVSGTSYGHISYSSSPYAATWYKPTPYSLNEELYKSMLSEPFATLYNKMLELLTTTMPQTAPVPISDSKGQSMGSILVGPNFINVNVIDVLGVGDMIFSIKMLDEDDTEPKFNLSWRETDDNIFEKPHTDFIAADTAIMMLNKYIEIKGGKK